jgi:hypothetical protein
MTQMTATSSEWFEQQPEPVQAAVRSITEAMAGAFDEVWRRAADSGQIATMAAGFLDGSVQFQVSRHGVLVLTDRPVTGEGVPDTPEALE